MSELQNAREIINKVDKEMARLFEIRMDAAKEVAKYKKEIYTNVYNTTI